MPEALMTRTPKGLVPADIDSAEAIGKVKVGAVIRVKFSRVRNYVYHQKFFVMAKFAFDHWEPGELPSPKWEGVMPEKNFDRFRKDLIIQAGYYEATYRLDKSTRIEAKSISFGSMDQEEFEELYSSVVDVVLKHVLKNYTEEELERVVLELLSFT
jgi:hypothetical protein